MSSRTVVASTLMWALSVMSTAQPTKSGTSLTESGAPRFSLSTETTFITEPLLPDGSPDYGRFLNRRFGEGVTDDNNVAAVLDTLFGDEARLSGGVLWSDYDAFVRESADGHLTTCERQERHEAFRDQWYRLGYGRCRSVECPLAVELVRANDGVLDRLVDASSKSRYWIAFPEGTSVREAKRPFTRYHFAQESLRARGFLALEESDWTGAAEHALALQRLGTVFAQGRTFFDAVSGFSQRDKASELIVALAGSDALRLSDARALAAALDRIEPMPTNMTADRFGLLATFIEMSRTTSAGWRAVLEPEGFDSDLIPETLYQIPESDVDWDEALRIVNRTWDDAEALLESTTTVEYEKRWAVYIGGLRRTESAGRLLQPGRLATFLYREEDDDARRFQLTRALVHGSHSTPEWSVDWWLMSHAKSVFARASLDLAIHRAEHGGWPDRLPADAIDAAGARGYRLELDRHRERDTMTLIARPMRRGTTFCWDGENVAVESSGDATFQDGGCEAEERAPPADTESRRSYMYAGFSVLAAGWILSLGGASVRARLAAAGFVAWSLVTIDGVLHVLGVPTPDVRELLGRAAVLLAAMGAVLAGTAFGARWIHVHTIVRPRFRRMLVAAVALTLTSVVYGLPVPLAILLVVLVVGAGIACAGTGLSALTRASLASVVVGLIAVCAVHDPLGNTGIFALVLLALVGCAAAAAHPYLRGKGVTVLVTTGAIVCCVFVLRLRLEARAAPLANEIRAEIESAPEQVPEEEIVRTHRLWETASERLPTSSDVWVSEEETFRRWAAESNVAITGTFTNPDYSARGYQKIDVTACLAGDADDIERLLERVEKRRSELDRAVTVSRETTADGVDVTIELFAKKRERPHALTGADACDSVLWSLPPRSELAGLCRDWRKAKPVLERLAEHLATSHDLERRETILADLATTHP